MSLDLKISKSLITPDPEKIADGEVKSVVKKMLSISEDTHKKLYEDIKQLYEILAGITAMQNVLDMGSHQIDNVTDPTANQDAATKKYVDDAIAALTGTELLTGDWIISSVTTVHTGWSNVSATYSNKFMRINATPLSTGGADTHTHGGATGSHTLIVSEMPAHTHSGTYGRYCNTGDQDVAGFGQIAAGTGIVAVPSEGGGGGHTHTVASADNVPAYVQVCIFQKS